MSIFGSGARKARSTATQSAPARRAVAETDNESDGQHLRERPRPQDLVLTRLATTWRDALPQQYRPTQLCELYPRVANRLALCWNDPALASRVLDDLMVDRRRNRSGFPPAVSRELVSLRLARSSTGGPSGFIPLWDASAMAITDR